MTYDEWLNTLVLTEKSRCAGSYLKDESADVICNNPPCAHCFWWKPSFRMGEGENNRWLVFCHGTPDPTFRCYHPENK